MKKSGSTEGQSASELIDKRIAELGDWRGETLSRMRKLIKEADPDVVEEWKWMGTPIWSHDGIICTGEYREVVENERLVYSESMSDENGNVLSPSDMGMPAAHPTTTEVRVELEDVGGRTKMVMTHAGIPTDSPGAAGWTMALDKLAAHVKAHSNR